MIGYLRARHAAKRSRREYEAARLLTLLEAIRADGARLAGMSRRCVYCAGLGAPHEDCGAT